MKQPTDPNKQNINIYYEPEPYGLTTVASIELQNMPYSFDLLVVWQDNDDNRFYYATDSGCSCPSPFESHKISDLIELKDVHALEPFARGREDLDLGEWASFFRTVRNAMAEYRND